MGHLRTIVLAQIKKQYTNPADSIGVCVCAACKTVVRSMHRWQTPQVRKCHIKPIDSIKECVCAVCKAMARSMRRWRTHMCTLVPAKPTTAGHHLPPIPVKLLPTSSQVLSLNPRPSDSRAAAANITPGALATP